MHSTMNRSKEKVLITGGHSPFGSILKQQLSAHFEVLVIQFSQSQIVAIEQCKELQNKIGSHFHSVLHLSPYLDFDPEQPDHAFLHTQHLWKNLRAYFTFEQWILLSTPQVYALCGEEEVLSEESPIAPQTIFASTLLRIEQWLRLQHEEVPLVIVRAAECYDDFGSSRLLENFFSYAKSGSIFSRLFSSPFLSFTSSLHIKDLAALLNQIIQRRDQLCSQIVVVAGEERERHQNRPHIWKNFIKKLLAWVGFHHSATDRKMEFYRLDTTRARTMLGWVPKHNLRHDFAKIMLNGRTRTRDSKKIKSPIPSSKKRIFPNMGR